MSRFHNTHHPLADTMVADYIGTATPLKVLGWGVDGVIYLHPSAMTAIKVHARPEKFANELAIYRHLRSRKVFEVEGFAIPKLVNADTRLGVIEMSIVKPPFLLDFAGAYLNRKPDFPDEVISEWWDRLRDLFEDDFPVAQSVFWTLWRHHKIYYWDMKPGNLQIRPIQPLPPPSPTEP
jgi:hypothetical protein